MNMLCQALSTYFAQEYKSCISMNAKRADEQSFAFMNWLCHELMHSIMISRYAP